MIVDRNKPEVMVKTITQTKIPSSFYDPSQYLTPFAEAHKARSQSTARVFVTGPVSIHTAKLQMQKRNIE